MEDRLTRRQAAIISAATGVLCGPFGDFHELAEQLMGRPVWVHEMGTKEVIKQIKDAALPLLSEITPVV